MKGDIMYQKMGKWVGILMLTSNLQAQIVSFSFNGAAGNESSYASDTVANGLIVGEFSRGSGVNVSSASGAFSASSWSTNGLDLNDYFTFSLQPSSGYQVTLTQLQLDERRSGTGIRDWVVRSSLDAFNMNIGNAFSVPDNSLNRSDQTISLTGDTFDQIGGPVEFRIYGFNAEGSTGTWRVDNVELYGTVTPVPEVSSVLWVAGSLLGFSFWRNRSK